MTMTAPSAKRKDIDFIHSNRHVPSVLNHVPYSMESEIGIAWGRLQAKQLSLSVSFPRFIERTADPAQILSCRGAYFDAKNSGGYTYG